MNHGNIGSTLRELRKKGRYTQAEFATLFGISRSFLSEIENGVKNPSVQLLQLISDKLQIPLAVIYLKALNLDDLQMDNKDEIIEQIKPSIERIESFFSVREDLIEA